MDLLESNVINLDIIMKNDRTIHCMGYVPDHNTRCFFTFLYGYPQHHKEERFGIPYFILKTLLVDHGLLLEISMKSYIPMRKYGEIKETRLECKILEILLINITF